MVLSVYKLNSEYKIVGHEVKGPHTLYLPPSTHHTHTHFPHHICVHTHLMYASCRPCSPSDMLQCYHGNKTPEPHEHDSDTSCWEMVFPRLSAPSKVLDHILRTPRMHLQMESAECRYISRWGQSLTVKATAASVLNSLLSLTSQIDLPSRELGALTVADPSLLGPSHTIFGRETDI